MISQPQILVVDDDPTFRDHFLALPGAPAYAVIPADCAETALDILNTRHVDLIVSDMEMPGMGGMGLFLEVQNRFSQIPFIFVTAFGSTETAVEAVKKGAFHYFEKPVTRNLDMFWSVVREALAKSALLHQVHGLRAERQRREESGRPLIIGDSKEIREVKASIAEIADLPTTVLISGETGVGKELVAQTIHHTSSRRDQPFFTINCHELAPGVLESELFGHERGAFTGALETKKGIFELAHKGSVFLDEISEYSESLQVKLLRVLDHNTIKRVGAEHQIATDFRLITATNRNLQTAVADGRFRQDLFYRLNVFRIEVPPLRQRRDDIIPIAEHYTRKFSLQYDRPIQGISDKAMLAMRAYDWPGNVRELINAVQRAVIVCKTQWIATRDLPFGTADGILDTELNLKEMEKACITLALRRTQNNKAAAAELLGITRVTLYEKLKKYKIPDPTP